MLNMIKMDLYRMFRTKSLYIIWIIMAAVLLWTTKLSALDYETIHQVGQETVAADEEIEAGDISFGISVMLPTEPGEEVTVFDIMYANMGAKFLGLFLVIFAVIFSTADISSGYVKNIAGQVKNRSNLIVSRAIVLLIFVLITLGGTIILQILSNLIIWGNLEWGSLNDFWMYMGTQTVLHCGLALVVMAIAVALKNNVASMVIAVCLCMDVMVVLYSGIDKLIAKIGVEDFHLFNYTVTGKITMLPMEMTGKECIEGIVIAVIFMIISTMITGFVFKKRDI